MSGVEVRGVLQEGLQGSEAGAQGHGVAHMQVVAALRHVEQMLVRLVDLSLLQGAVAQHGEHLLVGCSLGPGGQHGQGGGDAQRGEEDVRSGSGFGTQAFVEGEGEVGVGRGQLGTAHLPLVAGMVVVGVVLVVVDMIVVVVVVVHMFVVGGGTDCSQQQGNECTTSKDTLHLHNLSRG